MLVPLLFVGFLVIFFVLQKIIVTVKKTKKKSLHKKKLFTERKFEKCFEAKKMHRDHITGCKKNFNQKKSKLNIWHSYRGAPSGLIMSRSVANFFDVLPSQSE